MKRCTTAWLLGLLLAAGAAADRTEEKPLHERLGLSAAQWERLEAGGTVTRRLKQGERTVLRGYLLARATPDELFALVTDYPGQPRLYPELRRCTVLERQPGGVRVAYQARYGLFDLQWVSRDTFDKDRRGLAWQVVRDERYPSRIKRSEGFWRFTAVAGGLSLVQYQNDIELLRLPARLLRLFAAANMPAFARNIRRELAARRAKTAKAR